MLVTEAALQTGAFDVASSAAADAVRAMRASGENQSLANALVTRAALTGILGDAEHRFADAQEGLRRSLETASVALVARADVQLAAAARSAGNYDDAVEFAAKGGANAAASSECAVEYDAAEELIRAHTAWWHFREAAEEVLRARSIAEAAGAVAQTRLHCMSAWLYCSMGRFDAADRALVDAEFLIRDIAKRRDSVPPHPSYPLVLARFTLHYLTGIIALAEERCDKAIDAASRCLEVTPLVSLAPYRDAALKLELCARVKTGVEIGRDFPTSKEDLPASLLFATDSSALWIAAITVRRRTASARAELRAALDDLEERANSMPLDCDRALALLASVALEGGEPTIAARAQARRDHYYAARMAATAAHKSMRPRVSSGSMSRPSA